MQRRGRVTAAFALAATAMIGVAMPAAAADDEGGGTVTRRGVEIGELTPAEGRAVDRDLAAKMPVKIDPAAGPQRYLIRFADPAVPSYQGGIDGIPATQPDDGVQLDTDRAAVRTYVEYLRAEHTDFLQRAAGRLGRRVRPVFEYHYAVNGMAVELTGAEALELARDPDVVAVMPDAERTLHTDQGPGFIGAAAVWDATELGLPADYQGEGMVIGVIDTGIAPNNPSFADPAPDGYDHPAIRDGARYGICNPGQDGSELIAYDANFPCNDKLIGAYVYNVGTDLPAGQSWDYNGHGSHTTSTAGGNRLSADQVEELEILGTEFSISGVAPRAHLISYLGCCTVSALTASIDQAIEDEVDVINYSIGSEAPTSSWDEFDAIGFLNARQAGIFVATSNGNEGPGLYTVGSPGDVPWLTSVANQTHTRFNGNRLINMAGGDTPPPADILGKGATEALPATEIVYAGAVGDPMCLNLHTDQPLPPEGEGTPGDPRADYSAAWTGKIVVCDRGTNGRVQKSRNVAAHGAVGFVLANDEANGDSLVGDEFAVPGVMIGYDDGVALKTWLASGEGHTAEIEGFEFRYGDEYADFISATSSRGPNRFVDVLNPSVSAPGTDILAAYVDDAAPAGAYGGVTYEFISGTSMASPHVAGAGALIMQAHPTWTPAQIQSALMTTASPTVQHHNGGDGVNDTGVSTPDVQGSGRVQVDQAIRAGLLFHETYDNYVAANPLEGGDPKTLNIPSFMDSQCLATCSWTRTATVPADASSAVPADVTWEASYEADDGLDLTIDLSPATVSAGETMTITVTADVAGAEDGVNLYGRITLTPSAPDVPPVTMPLLVVPSSAVVPRELRVETRRDTGSEVIPAVRSAEVTDLTGSVAWVAGEPTESALPVDPTNREVYDDLSQVDVFTFEIPAGTASAVFDVVAAEMSDLDLFVGTGDTPGDATEVCVSATATALEYCQLTDPEPGEYWVVVQNWAASGSGAVDAYTLMTAFVPGVGNGTGQVAIPAGTIPTGEPYDVRYSWDLPGLMAGDVRYGAVVLGGAPGEPDHLATVPVTLVRVDDDVTKTASVDGVTVDEVVAGETVDFEITIQPNVRRHDLTYTVVDTIPAGLTLVEGSVTGELNGEEITGTVVGDTIEWEVSMPSPFLGEFNYVVSTPDDNPFCAAASGYVDIGGSIPLTPAIDGDTEYLALSPTVGPMPFYGQDVATFVIGEDGFIGTLDGFGDPVYEPQALPDPQTPNGVIAPLWSDFRTAVDAGSGVRVPATSSLAGALIIEWDNVFDYTADPSSPVGTFQLWMYNTVDPDYPEMTFEYDGLDPDALAALSQGGATVGVEDESGARATAVVNVDNPYATLVEAGSICLDYVGPVYPPATLTYRATVDHGQPVGTVLTNVVEHVTDELHDVPAHAEATLTVVERGLDADTPTIDFDEVRVGTTSAAETVTLTASGTGTVRIGSVSVPAPFEILDEDCTAEPVPADGECSVTVVFSPGAATAFEGALTIASNASGPPISIPLSGTGVEPVLDVGSPVWFDDTLVGASAVETVEISNPGTAALTIDDVSVTGPFTVDDADCDAPVAADGTCVLEITFSPTMLGLASGTLTLAGDDDESPHTVALYGVGLAPDLAVSPKQGAQFGEVTVGEVGSRTLALVNSGNAPLTIDGLAAADPFTVVEQDCTTGALAPAAACLVTVEFAPTSAGDMVGALTVESDAAGSPHDVVLAGTGVEPPEEPGEPEEPVAPIVPTEPGRYWDTRAGQPTFDGLFSGTGRLGAEVAFPVQITGRGDVPAGATGVVANLTVIDPDGPGYATLFPCSGAVPTASHVNYLAGETWANNAIVPLNAAGQVCVFTKAGADFALDVNGFVPDGSPLTGITPARYLDTRPAPNATFDGQAQGAGAVAAEQVVEVQIAGRGDVPADAVAALVNVTAVDPGGAGHLTLFPCGDVPNASTLNYAPGQVVPNGAMAELSETGRLCVYTKATSHILVDVTGYLTEGAEGLQATTPERFVDTRAGSATVDGVNAGNPDRLAADEVIEIQVAGRGSVPAGATAALFNVTAVTPDAVGYLRLFPCGDQPVTSNVNFLAGGVRANNALTALSDDGTVCVYAKAATDVILDVTGWIE